MPTDVADDLEHPTSVSKDGQNRGVGKLEEPHEVMRGWRVRIKMPVGLARTVDSGGTWTMAEEAWHVWCKAVDVGRRTMAWRSGVGRTEEKGVELGSSQKDDGGAGGAEVLEIEQNGLLADGEGEV